ncbi:sterol desaturase family protein [Acetobacteraceae bacterium]|nr:sterol desaturase family protein [Acetobacteraceae bacterium]
MTSHFQNFKLKIQERTFKRKGRSFDLGKMNVKQLWAGYLTYPTILLYFSLIAASAILMIHFYTNLISVLAPIALVSFLFPTIWYVIHRWIMHGKWFYQHHFTAKMWKRIHWDHHQDPHLMEVLFGSPIHTLPSIFLICTPVGALIGGLSGAFAAIATGLYLTCFYEFFHCIQHLGYKPKTKWVNYIKKLHVLHHFHDEDGNYGITNYLWDRFFSTYYESATDRPRSPKVFNLGYTLEEAKKYPWVMDLTGSPPRDRPDPAHPRPATA